MRSLSITRQADTYVTVDGATVTNHENAFRLAFDIACDAGFEVVGASNQTRSIYLSRPGCDRRLRIADHDNGRGGNDVQARLRSERVEVITTIEFEDDDGEIVTGESHEWMTVVGLSPTEICHLMICAITAYLAA